MSSTRLSLEVSPDQTRYTLTMPGYGYDDIDRAGNIAVWKITRQLEASSMRFFSDLEGAPYWARQMSKDRIIYSRAASYHVCPAVYNTDTRLYEPVSFTLWLTHAGKKSFRLYQEATSKETGEKLHGMTAIGVVGDVKTRMAVSLPDYVTSIFQARTETPPSDILEVGRSRPERPAGAHSVKQVALPSDLDEYQHVNQSNFIRYCHDAATKLAAKGGFSVLSQNRNTDLSKWHVKDVEVHYDGEWNAYESVTIHLWEDEAEPLLIHFEMEKENRVIYSSFIRFYPRD